MPNQQWFPQHQKKFKSLRESCSRCLHSSYKVQKFSIESNPIKLSVNETVWKGLWSWTSTTNPWNIATGEKHCLEQSWSFEKRVPMIPYWWDGNERLCWIVDGLLKTSEFLLHVKQREDKIIQRRTISTWSSVPREGLSACTAVIITRSTERTCNLPLCRPEHYRLRFSWRG